MTEVEAAISLYIARRDPIYIINAALFLSLVFKELIFLFFLIQLGSTTSVYMKNLLFKVVGC